MEVHGEVHGPSPVKLRNCTGDKKIGFYELVVQFSEKNNGLWITGAVHPVLLAAVLKQHVC